MTPNGCLTTGAITAGPECEVIQPVETLRLVGFTFGSDPGVGAHVTALRLKFRKKIWMLHHLRKAGIRGRLLYRLYCCYIRSVLEYCSPVYHSMLNLGQAEALERLHRQAIRVCFGFDTRIESIIETEEIES